MSILDGLTKRQDGHLRKDSVFMITESGKGKLGDSFDGGADGRVLMALESDGNKDMKEISRASGLSVGHVERTIYALLRRGYIQPTGQGDGYG